MQFTLQELAEKSFEQIEKIVSGVATEYASNMVRARDFPVSRRYGVQWRKELLEEFDRLNTFFLQYCEGWLLSSAIEASAAACASASRASDANDTEGDVFF